VLQALAKPTDLRNASDTMTPAPVYCSICGKKMKFEGVIPRAGFADIVAWFSCKCGHSQMDEGEGGTLRSLQSQSRSVQRDPSDAILGRLGRHNLDGANRGCGPHKMSLRSVTENIVW
jgi:hypothetical protein